MTLTTLPLAASAVIGFVILHRGIVADFRDVATRQREQVRPLQHVQLDLWETTDPVLLYLGDHDPAEQAAYRQLRERIESGFAGLHAALAGDGGARLLVDRARADWTEADRIAGEILSRRWMPGDPNGMAAGRRFETTIAASIDRLSAVERNLTASVDADYHDADRSFERVEWVAAIAAVVSIALMAAGAFVIGRILLASVDRLVEGAARFAAGDRDHQIEVRVPPELSRVADEFNRMVLRIKDSEAALAELARRDRLTGLLNRRAMDESLADAMARRRRLDQDVAVLMLDIDRFKQINDRYGHPAGDQVLQRVAKAAASCVREVDEVFRLGGEEFVVLLHDADRAEAMVTAERIRSTIAAKPVSIGAEEVPVTVSIGVAVAGNEADADSVLAAADAALYRAKHEGRNRVC
jgi:diguanylate cyclase (GGDEF)-like protein